LFFPFIFVDLKNLETTMRIENIALSDIAIDSPEWDQFVFTYPLVPGKLTASIHATGLQQPVLLAARDHLHFIVLGVKRLLACQGLGRSEIPALVRRTDSVEDLLWMSLHEKISTAPLNAMEKARVLMRFKEIWQNDFAALREKICPLLELPPTIESIENHLFLTRLPEWLQQRLASGELSAAHVSLLSPFRHDDLDAVADALFVRCQPSLQEAREMIENLAGLCAREDCRPRELLSGGELHRLLQDDGIVIRERTSRTRQWLHHQRYPRLAAAEKTFRELAAPLEKQAGLTIHLPRGFEGTVCQVRMQLSNETDVEKAATGLKQSLADKTWEKIFALLRDGGLNA
jgi:ParB/RepB/Spo0J family partition protein